MKLKGIFKGFSNATGLRLEIKTGDGINNQFSGSTTQIKGKKFRFPIRPFNDGKSSKQTIEITLVDTNGAATNFQSNGSSFDLDPNTQSFKFKINTKKKKGKVKLKPSISRRSEPVDNPEPGADTTDPTDPSWTLGTIQSLNTAGVSPHLDKIDNGYRLSYPSSGVTQISDLSSSFELTPRGQINRISDLTVVTSGDGVRRGYYIELNPQTGEKEIYTANITDDGLSLSNPNSTGFSDGGSMAWGVPDAVTLPDGRVRLYWVEEPPAGQIEHREWIVSATSTDITGTSFTKDAGQRTTGGYVDFEVLQAKAGDWIAVMSSTPETIPARPQGIYVGSSTNGLDWTVDTGNLAPTDKSYLDPTGVAIGANQWQLVMAESESVLGNRDYTLVQTTLTLG